MFTYQEIIEHLLKITSNGHNNISYAAFTNNLDLIAACKPYTNDMGSEIYGYACANNNVKVEQHLQDFRMYLSDAIKGFATCDDLTHLYSKKPVQAFKNALLEGFAQASQVTKVTHLLNRSAETNDINYESHFQSTIKGYASKNNKSELLELISGTNQFPIAVFEAAKNGHKNLVENLLKTQPLLRNQAIEGYCQGQHYLALSEFLNSHSDIAFAISALLGSAPHKAPLLLLLIHTDNEIVFDNILLTIKTYSDVNSALSITTSDIEDIKRIQSTMSSSDLNAVEAIIKNNWINPSPTKEEADLLQQLCHFPFQAQQNGKVASP